MSRSAALCTLLVLGALGALTPTAAAAAAALASAESNQAGVTVDLMTLERKGSVLSVKWAVRNAGNAAVAVSFQLAGDKVTTYLVDEENGTKYFVLTDKEGHVLASEHDWTGSSYGISDQLQPGETRRYWAKFPAPPPAVKAITVMFTEADPLEGVTITDK